MRLSFWFDKVSKDGDLQAKVSNKLSKLEKYLRHVSRDLREGFVALSKGDRWGYKVKVKINVPGKTAIAESKGKELLTTVDKVVDKLKNELSKRRDKAKIKKI